MFWNIAFARRLLLSCLGLLVVSSGYYPLSAQAQIPEEYTNLQVLPKDISREDLTRIMRGFAEALGVRCQHCHESNGPSFRDTDFPSDAKPEKEKARFMLKMLNRLNTEILPSLENRGDPPVTMTCKTCHRGTARPFLLSQELMMAAHNGDGTGSAAVARYRELRKRYETSGAYDFGEIETSDVAEDLAGEGRYDDAVALMKLNAEMNPESSNVLIGLGQIYEEMGDKDSALSAYEQALKVAPNNRRAQGMIDRLKGQG